MSSVSHTSLNHQLAEILFLYRASDALADDSLSALADRMLLAVDETGEDWVLPDGNLHYQVSQDCEYGNTDYPYLTYDDLFKLQKYLSDRFSRTDPVLDMLMQHKRAWMDANGYVLYELRKGTAGRREILHVLRYAARCGSRARTERLLSARQKIPVLRHALSGRRVY